MSEQDPTTLERLRTPLAVLVGAGLIAVAGCGSPSSGNHGPTPTAGVSQEAPAFPNVQTRSAAMARSSDHQLRRLAGYESALGHEFSDEMYFTGMPRNVQEAESQAAYMAGQLKEYSKYGIKPVIVMEPTNYTSDDNLPLEELHSPAYAPVLDALFNGLKNHGINDEQMGTLIPLPEADLPSWGTKTHSTDPELFAQNYAAIGGAYRKVFPTGRLSVLLDSTAYPTGDVNYQHGDNSTSSLMPYIEALNNTPGVPKIGSIDFQGFPWTKEDSPRDYLKSDVAIALARRLGVQTILFNTGTAEAYDGKPVPTTARTSQLFGELAAAEAAKAAGFNTEVNVFSFKDMNGKTVTVNWEYPLTPATHNAAASVAAPLPAFIKAADKAGVVPSIFLDQN